ncbi:MAG TPA: glutamine amidotransferase, partial [Gammaproteobacteria bacterium]|nr:glutamine amidotransferase [Gammaproteobacteria bacterium]
VPPEEGLACDLLVVLGGPIGVYDEAAYPFLMDEKALIAERLQRGGVTLG